MGPAVRRALCAAVGTTMSVLALVACSDGALAADRAVSPSGSDGNPCTPSAPCRSFDRAYEAASPGDVVEVAGGSYDAQNIDAAPKPSGPAVVFRPAAGAGVTVRLINVIRASNIEFQDMTVAEETYNRQAAQGITYRRVKMHVFFIRGADHISYIDSEVGPNSAGFEVMNWVTAPSGADDPATDILFDGVRIHDFKKYSAGAHIDCIGIDDVDGLVIRNSRLWNCEHFSIIFGNDSETNRAARNVLLENNFFDCCFSGYYSLGFGGLDGPVTVRFNSMTEGVGWLNAANLVPDGLVAMDSNVIADNQPANCSRGTWRYNVVATGSACGGKSAATGFAQPPADLHLRPGAAAIRAGNPSSHPATDIDGHRRPDNAPDAGADQLTAAPESPAAPAPRHKRPAAKRIVRKPTQWRRERGAPRARAVVLRPSLGGFLARGIRLRVDCSERCQVRVRASTTRRAAGRWDVAARLGSRERSARHRRATLRVKPSRRASRRLRAAQRLPLTLAIRARDRRGNRAWTTVRVTLRR
jgi:hypothetical protein